MNKKLIGIFVLLLAQVVLILDAKKISLIKNYFLVGKQQVVDNKTPVKEIPENSKQIPVDNKNPAKEIPESLKQIIRDDTDNSLEKYWLNGSIPVPENYMQYSKILLKVSCIKGKYNLSDGVIDQLIDDEIKKKDLDINEAVLFYRKKNLANYLELFSDYLDENDCKFAANDEEIVFTNKLKFKLLLIENNNDWEEINIKNDEGNEKFFVDKKSYKRDNQFVEANIFSLEFGSNGNLESYRDDLYIFNCKKQTLKKGISDYEFNYRGASTNIGNYFCKKYISENASNHDWVTYKSDDSTQVDMKSLVKTNDGWIRGNLRWLYKDGNGSPARSFEMKCKDDIQFLDSISSILRYFKVGQEWWTNSEIIDGTRDPSYLSDESRERTKKYKEFNDSKINNLFEFLCNQDLNN